MRSFMGKNQLTIECSNQWTIDSACRNYELIMKVLAGCGLSASKLYHINACPIFLLVSTISDVATGDGTRIRKETMECRRIAHRTSSMEWPNQPFPTLEQQNDCEHCLKNTF